MHIEVKLLYNHGGTTDWDITKGLPTPTVNDSGKISIEEVRKNGLAFRMNATPRKARLKVLMGFIITKLDMKRGRIRKRRCPRMKRVLGWSTFALGCHAQTI